MTKTDKSPAAADTQLVRTVLSIEILGTAPFNGDIEDVAAACIDGDFSGRVLATTSEYLTPDAMAALLIEQGSDPHFLGLIGLGGDRYTTMPNTLAEAVECEHGHLVWHQDPCDDCDFD